MKSEKNTKFRSIQLLIVMALTLILFGTAQTTLGEFSEFTSTAGVPEGVIADSIGNIYVSVSSTNDQIWKYSQSGISTLLSDLGESSGGAGGLAVDNSDNVYMCRFGEEPGVYRISSNGQAVKLPDTEQITMPNALIFDNHEALYVTESFTMDANSNFGQGGIWRIPKGGNAQLWLRDELLTGLAPTVMPFPLGANGIGFYHGDLYVANSDKGIVVRIPILQDGSPGQAEIWKAVEDMPESTMYQSSIFPVMLDGLTIDADGNVYVAVVSRNAIVRINAKDRSQETVAVYPDCPLDAPASMALNTREDTLFITNLGMYEGLIPNPEPWPGPGLISTAVSNKVDASGIWTGRLPRWTEGEEQLAHTQLISEEKNGISSIIMKVHNPVPDRFGMFPDVVAWSDSMGTLERTGPDTWNYTLISYGTAEMPENGYGEIIYIQLDRGTATVTDNNTMIANGLAEFYSGHDYCHHWFGNVHDQDTDPRDGFPDAGEEPIFSADYEIPQYRMPMLLPPDESL
jgi:sugar lactone lactonase YvrE